MAPIKRSVAGTSPDDSFAFCPACSQAYTITGRPVTAVPLLLSCEHSLCHSCVKASFSENAVFVSCKTCNKKTLPGGPINSKSCFEKAFPVADGLIEMLRDIRNSRVSVREEDIGFAMPKQVSPESAEEMCQECSQAVPEIKCNVCLTILCGACFEKLHSSGKTLRNHSNTPLRNVQTSRNRDVIATPAESKFKDETSQDETALLESVLKKCEEKRDRVIKSLLNTGRQSKEMEADLRSLRNERSKLRAYAADIQNSLTKILKTSMDKLECIEQSTVNSFLECEQSLKNLQKEMETTISALKNAPDSRRLVTIYENFDRLMKRPDAIEMLKTSNVRESSPPADCLKELREYLNKFDFGTSGEHRLVGGLDCSLEAIKSNLPTTRRPSHGSRSDLSDEQNRAPSSEPARKSSYEATKSANSEPSGVKTRKLGMNVNSRILLSRPPRTPLSTSEHPSYPQSQMDSFRKNLSPRGSLRNEYDNPLTDSPPRAIQDHLSRPDSVHKKVIICHIENPSNFWIQFEKSQHSLRDLNALLERDRTVIGPSLAPTDRAGIGAIYLYWSDAEGKWVRVQLVKMLLESEAEVLFLDYGLTRRVDCASLHKTLNKIVRNDTPHARKCSVECHPKGTAQWPEDVVEYFKKLVENKSVEMLVKGNSDETMYVDLRLEGCRSVCDHLVALEKAQYLPFNCRMPQVTKTLEMFKYQERSFERDQTFTGKAWHVESPGQFYVQEWEKLPVRKEYEAMGNSLNAFYNMGGNYKNHALRNLIDGMAVAAQYSEDNKWYRAEVLECVQKGRQPQQRYRVRYVDFGNEQILNLSKIRAIPESFTKMPTRVARCALFGVAPLTKKWTCDSTESFAALIRDEIFEVKVHAVTPQYGPQVSIYKNEHVPLGNKPARLCVNEMLVKEGLVRGVGKYSSIVPRETMGLDLEEPNSVKEDETPNVEHFAISVRGRDPSKIPISILECSDPYHIWVQTERQLISMTELSFEMAKYYNLNKRGPPMTSTLQVDHAYAVFVETEVRWYRAKLLSLVDEDTIRVFFTDVAKTADVRMLDVRAMTTEFLRVDAGCTRCVLSDYKDEADWPSELCKKLRDLCHRFDKYFMSIEGRMGSALRINLWAEWIKDFGPLEPMKWEWVNIGDALRKNDDKSKEPELRPLPLNSELVNLRSDSSVLSNTGLVESWLENVHKSKASVDGNQSPSYSGRGGNSMIGDADSDIGESVSVVGSPMTVEQPERDEWMPPTRLKSKQFIGIPQYITEDLRICFWLEEDEVAINVLQKKIQAHYSGSEVPHFQSYELDRVCMVLYQGSWYRARVLNGKPDDEQVYVEFIDYGNEEWFPASAVRCDVTMTRVPRKCHKLRVLPKYQEMANQNPKMFTGIIEELQKMIADKRCEIEVAHVDREEILRIKRLTFPMGETREDLYATIERLKTARRASNPMIPVEYAGLAACVPADADDASTASSSIPSIQDMDEHFATPEQIRARFFDNFTISTKELLTEDDTLKLCECRPPISEIVVIRVTEVLNDNLVAINLIECYTDPEVEKIHERFAELESELKREAKKQPLIKPPFIGRVCCTKFEENTWYRAIVVEKNPDENKYAVFYLDYGNIEYMVLSNLHQMKPEWYEVPAQAIKCRINFGGGLSPDDLDRVLNSEYRAKIEVIERADKNDAKYTLKLINFEHF